MDSCNPPPPSLEGMGKGIFRRLLQWQRQTLLLSVKKHYGITSYNLELLNKNKDCAILTETKQI